MNNDVMRPVPPVPTTDHCAETRRGDGGVMVTCTHIPLDVISDVLNALYRYMT